MCKLLLIFFLQFLTVERAKAVLVWKCEISFFFNFFSFGEAFLLGEEVLGVWWLLAQIHPDVHLFTWTFCIVNQFQFGDMSPLCNFFMFEKRALTQKEHQYLWFSLIGPKMRSEPLIGGKCICSNWKKRFVSILEYICICLNYKM